MKKNSPPKWALTFLQFFYKERYREQIEGDLYELFIRGGSTRKAKFRFGWNTLRFFRLRYLKGIDDFEQLTTLAMIKNYLKVAIRTLLKQKSYTAINISGLAVAIASALLISMYIFHEKSYDNFYPEVDRMYRVANGDNGRWTPTLLAQTIQAEIPQVQAATKVNGLAESFLEVGDQGILQDGGLWVDQNFLGVFDIKLLQGSSSYALTEPDHVILTETLADKYFIDEEPMNQVITIDGDQFKVVGIVSDPPKNTHIPYSYIVANHVDPDGTYYWSGNNTFTYLKLKETARQGDVSILLADLYEEKVGPDYIEYTGHETFEALKKEYPNRNFAFTLFPILDIHLKKPNFSLGTQGDEESILIFSLIAVFILIIACINYINLSTARSSVRSKEVGIRKSLGSQRKNIILQFLTESMLITLISLLFAAVLATLSIDLFNQLTQRAFESGDLFTPNSVIVLAVLLLIVGPLAGGYPAYVMSRFNPIQALKGGVAMSGKQTLRNVLVAFQFATSVFLIAITLVIYFQVEFLKSQDIGININNTLVVSNGIQLEEKYDVLKSELESKPYISHVSKSSNVPFYGFPDYGYSVPNESGRAFSPNNVFMAPGAEKIFNMELVDGRFFKANFIPDTAGIIVNQALAKELGWEDPVGRKLERDDKIYTVIGVVKDFNYSSLKRDVSPLIIRHGSPGYEIGIYHQSYILINFSNENLKKVFEDVEQEWSQLAGGYPFEARFLDDTFQRQFEAEKRFGMIFTTFSGMAIFIAILGLFALTTFVLQKRYKEIAVRKVMGATISSLINMIIKDFTKLVLAGSVFGIAAAFYWLNDWLQGYTTRIELSWYLLALPVLIILALTWLVVSTKSYQAAIANPSKALKDE
ncbi:ABC transporter permease [Ekhidna sp. To15]|uniref:ABC transporter permease n=1 Tax=Ekhidna sp. To15 TaxID=3395267 RepID=UPI003F526068